MSKYYWLLVDLSTPEELPLMVCDTAAELGKKCGVDASSINSQVLRFEKGKVKRSKYIRVRREENE